MSRPNLVYNIISLINDGAISDEEQKESCMESGMIMDGF